MHLAFAPSGSHTPEPDGLLFSTAASGVHQQRYYALRDICWCWHMNLPPGQQNYSRRHFEHQRQLSLLHLTHTVSTRNRASFTGQSKQPCGLCGHLNHSVEHCLRRRRLHNGRNLGLFVGALAFTRLQQLCVRPHKRVKAKAIRKPTSTSLACQFAAEQYAILPNRPHAPFVWRPLRHLAP